MKAQKILRKPVSLLLCLVVTLACLPLGLGGHAAAEDTVTKYGADTAINYTVTPREDGSKDIVSTSSGNYMFDKMNIDPSSSYTWPGRADSLLPAGAIRLAFDSADALGTSGWLNIKIGSNPDGDGMGTGLLIRLEPTANAAVGKVSVSLWNGSESQNQKFSYKFGDPLYFYIQDTPDVPRMAIEYKDPSTGAVSECSSWHNGIDSNGVKWIDYTPHNVGLYFNNSGARVNAKLLNGMDLLLDTYGYYSAQGVSVTKTTEGNFAMAPSGEGSVLLDPACTFDANTDGTVFPGTQQVVPAKMLAMTIAQNGDLSGSMAVRLENNGDNRLMIRDTGTATAPVLHITGYSGGAETSQGIDVDFAYGHPVYFWSVYGADANHFAIAAEQADGSVKVYTTDWPSGAPSSGTADKTARRFEVLFSSACTGVTAHIASASELQNSDLMKVSANSGVYTLSSDKASFYTIDNAMTFEPTARKYSGTDADITANLLKLTFAKDSLSDSSWLGVKMLGSGQTGSKQLENNMLLFRIQTDNGDGTGVLLVSAWIDNAEQAPKTLDYVFGTPLYVSVQYNADVNRFRVTTKNPDGLAYTSLMEGLWRSGPVTLTDGVPSGPDKAPVKPSLTSSGTFKEITASIVTDADVSDILAPIVQDPEGKYSASGVTAAKNADGGYSLQPKATSWFMFSNAVTFNSTSTPYANSDFARQENALSLKFADANALGGGTLIAKLGMPDETDGSKIGCGLGVRIIKDNGDGTGVLHFAMYSGTSEIGSTAHDESYRFGEEFFVSVYYDPDVYRMSVAVKKPDGSAYAVTRGGSWHDYTWGTAKNKDPLNKKFCLAFDTVCSGVTAKMVSGDFSESIAPPPVDTSVPFTGSNFTVDKNSDGYYDMTVSDFAKSTWKVDLTQGLIFNLKDLQGAWASLRVSGDYHLLANNGLGDPAENQYTLLFRNTDGTLAVSWWNGQNELDGKLLDGVSFNGTHILTAQKVTTDPVGVYYKLMIDGKTVADRLSIMEDSFNKLNNYSAASDRFDGTYFRFGTLGWTAVINDIRPFTKATADQLAGNDADWMTDTLAKIKKTATDTYELDMTGYSSARLNKQAELEKGLTFTVDQLEDGGQFGIAFGQMKASVSLAIPPVIDGTQAVYYQFKDNGDGTVTVTNSAGKTATLTMNIRAKHTYSMVKLADGNYSLAIDGKALFDSDLTSFSFIIINNGGVGAFPTLFTKAKAKITGFTGKLTLLTSSDSGDDDAWNGDDEGSTNNNNSNDAGSVNTGVGGPRGIPVAILSAVCLALAAGKKFKKRSRA